MSRRKKAGIIVGCVIAIIIIAVIATYTPTYTISVSVSPPGAGFVSPAGGQYKSGEQVSLTANPISGYSFDYWSGRASGTPSSIIITMDSDRSVTANFVPAPTDIGSTEAQQLTGYLEEISRGWDRPSVDGANSILSTESLGPEAWESFFEEYFSDPNHHFTDDLRNYLTYPTFHWFSDDVHANLQQGLFSLLIDIINSQTDAYLESDRAFLTQESPIVQSLHNSHRFLHTMIHYQVSSLENRDNIIGFYKNLIKDNPNIYGNASLDVDKYPFAGAFRAQAHINLAEALQLTDTILYTEIADILELGGIKRDIFQDYGVLLIDNNGLDTHQLEVIKSILESVPSELHNLCSITVNSFLGNDGDEKLRLTRKVGVNIFGNKVGTRVLNMFPNEVPSHLSDGFSRVAIHELNHRVDGFHIKGNETFEKRKEQLLEQAGVAKMNYLRSDIRDGYFQETPQEFFAAISNQYFSNSEHTLSLGIERFNQGRPEPLNQFLFFADVYSRGGSSTLFYTLDTAGNLAKTEVPIVRDGDGHIIELHIGAEHYGFQLDTDGNVVSVILP